MTRLLILFICLTLLSCTDRDDELQQVQIRVRNMNTFQYDRVVVGEEEGVYETVLPGEYSEYLPYDTAFRYAYVQITSGDSTFVVQPVDFVGESPLPLGFYTYELTATEDESITIDFVFD